MNVQRFYDLLRMSTDTELRKTYQRTVANGVDTPQLARKVEMMEYEMGLRNMPLPSADTDGGW